MIAEQERIATDARRTANWKRWGPYLSERQWATVREGYSPDGTCWEFFPHQRTWRESPNRLDRPDEPTY
jgi:hypothetical protein